MARQWISVGAVVAVLAAGALVAVRLIPPPVGMSHGDRLPEYRVVRAATGDSVSLRHDFAGHVTLINLWATWCAPCREEMPSIERVFHADSARGLRVAAVSIDDGAPAAVLDYAQQMHLSFDVLQDRTGGIQDAYRTVGLPQSVLIDRRGRVRYVALGARSWDIGPQRALIDSLLGAP